MVSRNARHRARRCGLKDGYSKDKARKAAKTLTVWRSNVTADPERPVFLRCAARFGFGCALL
jgi:hypothetical protein